MPLELKWRFVSKDLPHFAPQYGSKGAVGIDLCTAGDAQVRQGLVTAIGTNIMVEIPEGFYGRIAPRSGLALRHGVTVLAGVVDPDYRGEIRVLLTTHIDEHVTLKRGERVAQLILERAERLPLVYSPDLGETDRGSGGFGSTGK